jgi:hypothetical protein
MAVNNYGTFVKSECPRPNGGSAPSGIVCAVTESANVRKAKAANIFIIFSKESWSGSLPFYPIPWFSETSTARSDLFVV